MLWQRFDLQSKKMNELVQRLAQSRVFLDPTLVVLEFSQEWDMDTEKNDLNNQYLPSTFVEEYASNWKQELSEVPVELHAATTEALQKEQKFVGMCSRAGVRIIAGTDRPGIGRLMPGFGKFRQTFERAPIPFPAFRSSVPTPEKVWLIFRDGFECFHRCPRKWAMDVHSRLRCVQT